ncbi:PilN domain-containing protein [Cronbergia sp. UHCC 0137]|uniref:PilN domain-containing protein n=1 Tax=Cronbergia sp. UHCC 0137 TaxID=3110239 RepID=UPI002B1EC340|nr:PilN domain-containing protein [Cronbergia sp. UHCC 0137]MEA5618915.1 PilN domain-containing protein [Cronbergia sp. UHCC 0137]
MYSLDINFLKDRKPDPKQTTKAARKPIELGNLVPVYLGVGVGLCFPALVFLSLWFIQGKTTELEQLIGTLEQESQDLDIKLSNIKKIKDETAGIEKQTQALITVFDQIRPWSAMLQDLRDRIPKSVQIESIRQTPPPPPAQASETSKPVFSPIGGLEITGYARSFSDVNDFLLILGQSKFLNAAENKINTAELIDAPPITGAVAPTNPGNIKTKPLKIVKYTIKASLSNVPATELIRELEQKGTVGLVARLRNIQKTGVISK